MHGLPSAAPGLRIGLLGGSFDPAHAGHVHVTREALKRLDLDRVWWLVSPGNPLKPAGPAPLADRMRAARAAMDHPRTTVTDLESRLGTRYTAETLARLRTLYPGVRFVWVMGADNLADLHRWQRWQRIMHTVPVAVIDRPGQSLPALRSRAARRFAAHRVPASAAAALAFRAPPAWCFVRVPLLSISSSALRAQGAWRPWDT